MSSVSVLIGASVVTFLLILLFWKLGTSSKGEGSDGSNTHVLLQVLLLGFILVGIVLIGKASMDDSGKSCAWLVNQSIPSGSATNYTYFYECVETGESTGNTFYEVTVWILRIVGVYIFCYLVYVVLVYFGYLGGGDKGRDD